MTGPTFGAPLSGSHLPAALQTQDSVGTTAVLARPEQMQPLLHELRPLVAAHSDTAWVVARPSGRDRVALATLSRELLDAAGVVGLAPPRHAGEGHLLRAHVHLAHGPVNDVVVYDATHLDIKALTALHTAVATAGVSLWLIFDNSDGPYAPGHREQATLERLTWVRQTCTAMTAETALHLWSTRPNGAAECPDLPATWWRRPLATGQLPPGCTTHTRIECLLARTRRALAAGPASPQAARLRLTELIDHPDVTVSERWELTAAGRDLYTPGMDALNNTHPSASLARIADVAADGSTVLVDGISCDVAPMMRPAVARLRLSRTAAGVPAKASIRGLFDRSLGPRTARRR